MNKRGMVTKTILIIEDNADNRTLLKDLLEIKGYQVLEAGDSEAGQRITREQKPDLVLMDIQMPGVTGLTVIRELKSDQQVRVELPPKARIFNSVTCAFCGEPVAEVRARVREGKFACIPCAGEYSRGW